MQANLVEGFDLKAFGALSARALHAEIEAIKVAKSDIYRYVADPKFTTVPTVGLLAKDYAAARRALIDMTKPGAYPAPGQPAGTTPTSQPHAGAKAFRDDYDAEQHTTSFSIVDSQGNAIAVTPTLGGLFGNNVVVGSTGLLLNNGIRLGSTSPYPSDVNYVGAGKVPILNNSPVVVMKDGKPAFVFGSPGGETIGQTEFQMLVNLIDFDLPVQQAIEAPRFVLTAKPNFYKPGAEITVEIENRVPAETIAALKAMGHTIRVLPGWGSLGHMQAIRIDPKTGTMMAGGDPRRTAYAMGVLKSRIADCGLRIADCGLRIAETDCGLRRRIADCGLPTRIAGCGSAIRNPQPAIRNSSTSSSRPRVASAGPRCRRTTVRPSPSSPCTSPESSIPSPPGPASCRPSARPVPMSGSPG